MKALLVNGSPHKAGNTATALAERGGEGVLVAARDGDSDLGEGGIPDV